MAKNANPVEAHRKAMRKRELKRNKETRAKVKEISTLKKDTGQLEGEVRRLTQAEQAKELDAAGVAKLTELREELNRVKQTKQDYVKANPGSEDIVYKQEKEREKARQAARNGSNAAGSARVPGVPIYGKRSVFYHEVLNPLGYPPPGMFDQERGPDVDEMVEGSSSGEDSDSDIQMPEGSPSGQNGGDDSDSDDSIVMPEGDAPPEAKLTTLQSVPLMTPAGPTMFMPHGPGYHQPNFYPNSNFGQRPPFGVPQYQVPPPPGFFPPNRAYISPQQGFRPHHSLPPRTPHVDPLSDVPHQTFQAHRQAQREGPAASGPIKPEKTIDISAAPAAAIIEAAPEIRNFHKEAAAFVPRAAKKKKVVQPSVKIDAAAASEEQPVGGDSRAQVIPEPASQPEPVPTYNPAAGSGLLGKLSGILGPAPTQVKPQDDYQAFLAGLDGLQKTN